MIVTAIITAVVPATPVVAGFGPGRAGGNRPRDRQSRERRHPKLLHVVPFSLSVDVAVLSNMAGNSGRSVLIR